MTNTAFNYNEYMNNYKNEHNTYADMIQFCTEGKLILNNEVIQHVTDWEVYAGNDYDEETEEYEEVFQYYIITEAGAEQLEHHTNELVYYIPSLDMYLLGVTHWGTAWNGVPANWKYDTDEE